MAEKQPKEVYVSLENDAKKDAIKLVKFLMDSGIKTERFALVAENWSAKSMILALLKAQKKNYTVFKISKIFSTSSFSIAIESELDIF